MVTFHNGKPITSKLPSVRALLELKALHLSDCLAKHAAVRKDVDGQIAAMHERKAKESIKTICEALNGLDVPYTLVHNETCNIRKSYDNKLVFELVFDPEKAQGPQARNLVAKKAQARATEFATTAALDKWLADCLYLVASKNPKIPKFVPPKAR